MRLQGSVWGRVWGFLAMAKGQNQSSGDTLDGVSRCVFRLDLVYAYSVAREG